MSNKKKMKNQNIMYEKEMNKEDIEEETPKLMYQNESFFKFLVEAPHCGTHIFIQTFKEK